jgi:hypothetical protein
VPADVRGEVGAAGPDAFFAGLNDVFLMLAVVGAAGAVLVVALIRRADFVIPPGGRAVEAKPGEELAAVP